uniref:Uncharacterized protein n=1 Tax=Arundo donax TaxID=35708 RepID=A0A0A8Z1B8_ARUDO
MRRRVKKEDRKGVNSLIILGAWMLWKHRNACVFGGASPNLQELIRLAMGEYRMWCIAGARGLSALGLDRVDGLG